MSVLMLHGAGGGAWEWNVWRRVFAAAGRSVICPELQPSPRGIAATRFEDYLDQAIAAARESRSPPVAIGASLGGLLALALAPRIECAALILVNPMPPLPEAASLPARSAYPDLVPWARDASLAGTRAALPDSDEATCLYAFRRWRDESGNVLNAARAGLTLSNPQCPILVFGSETDDDVPVDVSEALAARLGASFLRVPGGHVGPLLGLAAAMQAEAAVHWLNAPAGFRTD